jgi:hypothetical protein
MGERPKGQSEGKSKNHEIEESEGLKAAQRQEAGGTKTAERYFNHKTH